MNTLATKDALNAKFVPTKYSTAEDKAKFVKSFINFFDKGCNRNLFTKGLYNHLHLHFMGHIAHYDIDGFYGVWFSDADKQYSFLAHASKSRVYGDPAWTFSDAEKVLQTWINRSGVLEDYEQKQADYLEDKNTYLAKSAIARLSSAKQLELAGYLQGLL